MSTRKALRDPVAEELALVADGLEQRYVRAERGTLERRILEHASLGVRRVARSIEIERATHGRARRDAQRRRAIGQAS